MKAELTPCVLSAEIQCSQSMWLSLAISLGMERSTPHRIESAPSCGMHRLAMRLWLSAVS